MMVGGPTAAIEDEQPRPWYFTFGGGDVNAGHFIRVYGTFESSRAFMLKHFGRAWGFQYETAEDAGVDRFGLEEFFVWTGAERRCATCGEAFELTSSDTPEERWCADCADVAEHELRSLIDAHS